MAKEKGSDKAALRERLCHTLDIQPDIFPGGTLVEIRGQNSVTVKGGGRITLYTDSEIRLCYARGELSVKGKRLCCSAYHRGAVVIDGLVEHVDFEEVDK